MSMHHGGFGGGGGGGGGRGRHGGGGRSAGGSGGEAGAGIDIEPETLTWLDGKSLAVRWDGGAGYVDLTIGDEQSVLRMQALHAFPQSDPNHYVQIYAGRPDGGRGRMVGMFRDLTVLAGEPLAAIRECLRRAYVVPRIVRIVSIKDQRHLAHWVIETDRGRCEFDMNDMYKNIRIQSGGRVVLTDIFENRYEILSLAELDAPSRAQIAPLI
ncbi:MAG: DUF1854 domain-containing protein [Planctomycetota bacterium]